MPKPRTCNASVAALIRKFGLTAVQAAIEMAVELAKPNATPKPRTISKNKAVATTNLVESGTTS